MANELYHYGIKGQKWGRRRFQNPDGTLTAVGKQRYSKNDTVFVSGKVKFDKEIPKRVRNEIDTIIENNAKIIIGDAPGTDKRVQDYLAKKGYLNVEVYTTDKQVRNNVGGWNVNTISGNGETDERSIRRQKDIAMTQRATKGLAISSDDDRPDSATALNIRRLADKGVNTLVYDYKKKKWSGNK